MKEKQRKRERENYSWVCSMWNWNSHMAIKFICHEVESKEQWLMLIFQKRNVIKLNQASSCILIMMHNNAIGLIKSNTWAAKLTRHKEQI